MIDCYHRLDSGLLSKILADMARLFRAWYGCFAIITWWRHQMETFSALLAICAVNSPVSGEFPAQRTVTRSFDNFFDLCLNKRLSKQSRGWWLETISCPLWRQCNETRDGWVVSGCFLQCHFSIPMLHLVFQVLFEPCFITFRNTLCLFLASSSSGAGVRPHIARFKGPTWGPPGAGRTQVGPMLGPWTLLSGPLWKWLWRTNCGVIWKSTTEYKKQPMIILALNA